MTWRFSQLRFLILLMALVAATSAVAVPRYRVVDLGFSGTAFDINDSGQIAGTTTYPFLFDTSIHDLGFDGHAAGINNNGVIAGTDYGISCGHACLYDGRVHDLGTIITPVYGDFSYGFAINDSGIVVGASLADGTPSYGNIRAFLYDGAMHDLGTLFYQDGYWLGNSWAQDINNNGRIVGWSSSSMGGDHAFIYDGTMHDLGTLTSGGNSYAYAINVNGVVVGTANPANSYNHAFLYDGAMHDLGTLGGSESTAYDINDSGQVVGGLVDDGGAWRAFLYQEGVMRRLDQLLVNPGDLWPNYFVAYAINNRGQIVGRNMAPWGNAVRFDPVVTPAVGSVEPSVAPNSDVTHIAIAGTSFSTGASVKLTKVGQADIAASNVLTAGGTSITCDLGLNGAAPGLWNVVVTNPDGESGELAHGFAVELPETSSIVGAANKCAQDEVVACVSSWLRFKFWGTVTITDPDHLLLDDGSGIPVRVPAAQHTTVSNGDYASATGTLDTTVVPVTLLSTADQVQKLK